MTRRRPPVWPSCGPDPGEDILKLRRECLSPGWQEVWDREYFKRDPVGRLIAAQNERLEFLEEEVRPPRRSSSRRGRTSYGASTARGAVLRTEDR